MKLILSDLYHLYKDKYLFTLIAGEKGLNGMLTWVYVTEDILTTDFLRGGELVITTGLSADRDEEWLLQFIKELIKQRSCGLIINTGNYIFPRDISDEVIDYCNQNNFPLITMPWHIHISDVMNDYYNEIFIRKYQENIVSELFRKLITDPATATTQTTQLNSYGFPSEASYGMVVISDLNSHLLLENILNNLTIRHHICAYENLHIMIYQDCFEATLRGALQKLFNSINSAPNISFQPHIGVGNNVSSLSQLYLSFKEAVVALDVAKFKNQNTIFFNDLGVYRILLSVPNKELLKTIFQENLGTLLEYDKQNNADLMDTLMWYLDFDGSIQKTADALFTHRNTINYRMQKINSLLKKDLASAQDKFDLKMAFYIRKMIQV